MNLLELFGHQHERTTRRLRARRRPLVEALEGRQLLSSFTVTAAIQGNHIGTNVAAAVQRKHIGTDVVSAGIQGNHIGTNLV